MRSQSQGRPHHQPSTPTESCTSHSSSPAVATSFHKLGHNLDVAAPHLLLRHTRALAQSQELVHPVLKLHTLFHVLRMRYSWYAARTTGRRSMAFTPSASDAEVLREKPVPLEPREPPKEPSEVVPPFASLGPHSLGCLLAHTTSTTGFMMTTATTKGPMMRKAASAYCMCQRRPHSSCPTA